MPEFAVKRPPDLQALPAVDVRPGQTAPANSLTVAPIVGHPFVNTRHKPFRAILATSSSIWVAGPFAVPYGCGRASIDGKKVIRMPRPDRFQPEMIRPFMRTEARVKCSGAPQPPAAPADTRCRAPRWSPSAAGLTRASVRMTDGIISAEPIGPRHADDLLAVYRGPAAAVWYGEWSRDQIEEEVARIAREWLMAGVHKWMAYDRATVSELGRGGLSRAHVERPGAPGRSGGRFTQISAHRDRERQAGVRLR